MNWEMSKCDRCGKSDNKEKLPLHRVYFSVDGDERGDYGWNPFSADWCGGCLTSLGLKFRRHEPVETKTESTEEVKPPTLEDLIREIVRQENQG